jgi:tetratricopeptide (TPR) repeat protein
MISWLVLSLLAQDELSRAAAADRAGNFREAAQLYHAAAERDPSETNLLQLVNYLIRYNGSAEALKVLPWALEKYPRSAPLRVSVAAAHYALSNYDEAAKSICEAVDLDPADRRTLRFLGDFREISPAHAGAIRQRLAGYVTRYPADAFARFHYGMTLAGAQRESQLRQARKLDPALKGPALELAILLDKTPEAESLYREAIRLDPSSVNAHYRLAQLYARTSRPALAKRHFDEVTRLKTAAAR